jgi:hypothetical protein
MRSRLLGRVLPHLRMLLSRRANASPRFFARDTVHDNVVHAEPPNINRSTGADPGHGYCGLHRLSASLTPVARYLYNSKGMLYSK